MARSAEGLPTRPKKKVKPKKRYPKKGPRPGNHKGGAAIGNKFHLLAQFFKKPKSLTPQELLDGAIAYFQWVDANPLLRNEVIKSGDQIGRQVSAEIGRPYTVGGLCMYLGISEQTFLNYSEAIGYQEYFEVSAAIRQAIKTQKFEGAAVGIFNPAIIARDLGLVDKQERDIGNKNGIPFQTENKTLTAEITPDMDEKTASQIYRTLLNPPKPEA